MAAKIIFTFKDDSKDELFVRSEKMVRTGPPFNSQAPNVQSNSLEAYFLVLPSVFQRSTIFLALPQRMRPQNSQTTTLLRLPRATPNSQISIR